ncbi:MAG: T9SS type A sorting domain-containing protein [Bacteroidetes bacterium]|nr:T9SS type A sorting domain-containing protein [Bacteroidota bacterium]
MSSDPGPNCNSIASLEAFFGTDDVVKYNWDEGAGMFVLDEELTEDVDIIDIIDIEYKLKSDGTPDYSEPIAVTWSLKEGTTAYAVSGIAVKQGQPCPSESDLVDYGGDPVTAGGTIKVEGTAISYIAFGIVPLENECKSTIVADLDNSTGEVVFKNDYGITELYFHLPDTDGLPDSGQPAVEGLLIDNVTGLDNISGTDDFDHYYASSGTDPGEVVVTFKDDPNTEDQQRFFLIAYSANSAGNATTRQQEEDPENTDPVCRTVIDPPFPMEQATTRFAVGGSYPNPFTGSTTIRFDLPEPAEVNLAVYNVMGQKVAQLVDRRLQKGPHAVAWDGRSNGGARLSSGLYFYRLTAGDRTEVHRLTLVR